MGMKTQLPFNLDDEMSTKLEVLEKRIRNWMNKRYDLLDIEKNTELRDKLFDIDMAIFMKTYLWRTFYIQDIHSTLESAMSGSIEESTTGEKNNGK